MKRFMYDHLAAELETLADKIRNGQIKELHVHAYLDTWSNDYKVDLTELEEK